MNRAFVGCLSLVLLAVACGSGASNGKVGDAAAAGDGDTDASAPNGEGIFAKVDGQPKSWTADLSVLAGSDLHLSAGVVGSLEAFQIDVFGSPLVGTHTCATGASLTYLSPGDGATPAYFRADGASGECSVTLTKSADGAGETYEGTFTGTVVASNDVNRTFTFTDGIFKVRR
jgi:hypothetical protein